MKKLALSAAITLALASSAVQAANPLILDGYTSDDRSATDKEAFKSTAANSTVTGPGHLVVGQNNTVNSTTGTSSAVGNQNRINGHDANAFGDGNVVYGEQAMGYGDNNKVNGNQSSAFGVNNNIGNWTTTTVTVNGTTSIIDVPGSGPRSASTSVFGSGNNVTGAQVVAIGHENNVTGSNSLALGIQNKVTGDNSVAIGSNVEAHKTGVAIGSSSKSLSEGAIALGVNATSQDASVSLGTNSTATGESSLAAGNNANATGFNSIALGMNTTATARHAVVLGDRGHATHEESVALGSGSETKTSALVTNATIGGITYGNFAGTNTDKTGVVSVGSDGTGSYTANTRQIVNVGAGAVTSTSTDAINGSQLYSVADQVSNNTNRINNIRLQAADVEVVAGDNIVVERVANATAQTKQFTVSTSKNLTADSLTINNGGPVINSTGINANNTQITNVKEGVNGTDAVNMNQLNRTNGRIHNVDRRSRAGIAGVGAIASAPSARKDGKSMVSAGVAHHRGESAIAIKASRNSDNGHWSSNLNGATDTRGQWTVGAGVGYEW